MIHRLVVFGASGDLAGRFLLPALAELSAAAELPDDFTVLGAARTGWGDDEFRRYADDQLEQHGADVPAGARKALVNRLHYHSVDVTNHTSIGAALQAVSNAADTAPLAAYLALPTGLVSPTVAAVGAAGLPSGSRLAVEKPFGEDLRSAQDLNALLADVLGRDSEQAVFRVDHALGMATVQNLLPLRFANRIPEALWNSEHIAEIDVLWEETLALEGRAAFYDKAGALRDVMQNHMMQVFSMIAMERPDDGDDGDDGDDDSRDMFPAEALRRRKLELLRSVRELSADDVVRTSRRARYTAGQLTSTGGADGRRVPDYAAEDGVDPDRSTETFAEVVLAVDNRRWSGTHFRLRAGKALSARRKGILVRFRPPPSGPSSAGRTAYDSGHENRLWIGVDGPNHISLSLNMLAQGHPWPAPLTLTGPEPETTLSPYAQVLLNLLQDKSDLAVGSQEAEQAWRILGPVREAWDRNLVPLQEYPAGSEGPAG
jgi:glucose-6-phosphate 1-dehydrogenase